MKTPRFNYPVFGNWRDTMPDPLVDEASSSITYYGYSDYGVGTSEAKWMIWKVEKSGNVTKTSYAGGRKGIFGFVWDNRASLDYRR